MMTQTILFYSNSVTPRLRYTIETIVGNLLGLNIVFTQDKDPFVDANIPKINYSKTRLSANEIFVESHDLLFEKTIKPYLIEKDADFFAKLIDKDKASVRARDDRRDFTQCLRHQSCL